MGQDFHVAADLLVGYPGIYLGGFQIRMPQKTAYGLDSTPCEQHGGGVRMPGHMIGQPYLETALPAKGACIWYGSGCMFPARGCVPLS